MEKNKILCWPAKDSLALTEKFKAENKNAKYFLIVLDDENTEHTEEVKFEIWEKAEKGDVLKAERSKIYGTYYGLLDK